MNKQKRLEISNLIYAWILFATILFFFAANACNILSHYLKKEIENNNIEMFSDKIEALYITYFWNKYGMINLNGAMREVLGIREMNGYIKLNDGVVAPVTDLIDEDTINEKADTVACLSDYLASENIPLIFTGTVISRNKYDNDQFPFGVYDYVNENEDNLIKALTLRGVDVLDYREEFHERGYNNSHITFREDHHWTPIAGFYAFQMLADHLDSYGVHIDERYRNIDNYQRTTYKNLFVGSSGRSTGKIFSHGAEDFELIIPREWPMVTNMYSAKEVPFVGESGVIVPTVLGDPHEYRANENENILSEVYKNSSGWYKNEDSGGHYRIIVVGDSQTHVVMPYLVLSCEEVHFMWFNTYYGLTEDYIWEFKPDAVVLMMHPDNYPRDDFTFLQYNKE